MIKVGDRVLVTDPNLPTQGEIAIVIEIRHHLTYQNPKWYTLLFDGTESHPTGYAGMYRPDSIKYVDSLSTEEMLTHNLLDVRMLARGRTIDGMVL